MYDSAQFDVDLQIWNGDSCVFGVRLCSLLARGRKQNSAFVKRVQSDRSSKSSGTQNGGVETRRLHVPFDRIPLNIP